MQMAMPSALHKKEQDMTKAKSTFRSANQTPSNKARWVNRWMAFHRAFPDVSIGEWCGLNNLSHHTFQNWLRDPKLNREKRIKAKIVKEPEAEKLEEEEDLSLLDFLEMPLEDETEAEKQACREAKEILQKVEEPSITAFAEDTDEGKVTYRGAFVTFTCADYRIEISKENTMDADEMTLQTVKEAMKDIATEGTRWLEIFGLSLTTETEGKLSVWTDRRGLIFSLKALPHGIYLDTYIGTLNRCLDYTEGWDKEDYLMEIRAALILQLEALMII